MRYYLLLKSIISITIPSRNPSEKCSKKLLKLVLLCISLPVLSLWSILRLSILLWTISIIGCSFLYINQIRISITNLFKYLFRTLIISYLTLYTIFIRVEPQCKFFICFLNLCLIRSFRNTKNIIVIFFTKIHCNLFFHLALFFIR